MAGFLPRISHDGETNQNMVIRKLFELFDTDRNNGLSKQEIDNFF